MQKIQGKFLLALLILLVLILGKAQSQTLSYKPDKAVLQMIKSDYKIADGQYKVLMKGLRTDQFPKTFYSKSNALETSTSEWWCSGFYPGTLLMLYNKTKDPVLLAEADRIMKVLAKEQYNKSTHDLGFMMYCSFGTAQKISPNSNNKNILINSAKSLSSRFDPKIGCIKSWDSKKPEFLVIIDNMMNLELLFYATRVTGDSSYYKIAVSHANTTMKNHFRADYSSYHVVNYNPLNGDILQRRTAQGFSNESAWARGQAWGLYGYTVMYRETHDKRYLDQAENIAHYILANPNFPKDKIPYWDFNAPNIPNAYRDASAAAVMASGFLELCRYADPQLGKLYFTTAETMIKNLSAPQYLAEPGSNGGFILQHSIGHIPENREIDVPLTYADYYFIEALGRYQILTEK